MSDFAAFKDALLRTMAEEDRLPGPPHRDLAEVMDEHGVTEPEAGWAFRAATEFCEQGLIQLDEHRIAPVEGEPIVYAITLHGLERAGAL